MSLNILNSIARNDERFAVLKSRLLASAAPLSLMLLLLSAVSEPVLAQNAAPAASVPGTLDPVVVNPRHARAMRARCGARQHVWSLQSLPLLLFLATF
jgi:hypothetical protein